MTNEQIRQNAEEYAEQNKVNFSEDKNFEVYDYVEQKEAFLAGAHSRDEEINGLQAIIDNLIKACGAVTDITAVQSRTVRQLKAKETFSDRGLNFLATEIEQLRNPWISVAEMLPEDVGNVGKVVIVLTDMGDIFNSFLSRNKIGRLMWNSDKGLGKPIFWMPIPKLKGGDK